MRAGFSALKTYRHSPLASRIRIAVDGMGGDLGVAVAVPAVVHAIAQFPDIEITLVGDQSAIYQQLQSLATTSERLTVVHAPDVVAMDDKPSTALRRKPESSMRLAINLLQEGCVDAVVSAGNTGALMAMGCMVLKTIAGIDRPAICAPIPSGDSHLHLLDLGANVDTTAEHLHQFAVMGSALCKAVDGIQRPRVAVLNNGTELIKGNEQVKLAGKLIADDKQLNYVGNIEGDGLLKAAADVVVCDGFVGNVALKVCEGTASYISAAVSKEFKRTWLSRLSAFIALPVLKKLYRQLDPQRYNGASLLGLQGVVVKSHGSSDVEGFVHAILQAKKEVDSDIVSALQMG